MSADLDDFFAKKDKNRKKKTKGISNETFVQKYEAKYKDTNNKENKSAQLLNNLEGFIEEDGEWKDFEDENKDYSGLKIQALIISDDEREKEEEDIKKETIETPWGKKEDSSEENASKTDNPDQNDQQESTTEQSATASSSEPGKKIIHLLLNRQKNKQIQAHWIDDAVEFPDLGATQEVIEDAKTFQPVRSSMTARIRPPPPLPNQRQYQSESVSTDNKYNVLRNNY